MPTFRSVHTSYIPFAYYVSGRRLSVNIAPRSTTVLNNIEVAPESAIYIASGALSVYSSVPVYGGGTVANPTARQAVIQIFIPPQSDPALRRSEFLQVYPRLLNELKGTKANEAEMLATVCEPFDFVRRSDAGAVGLWVLLQAPASVVGNWEKLSGEAAEADKPALAGLVGGGSTNLDGVTTTSLLLRTVRKVQQGDLAAGSVYMREAVLLENTSSYVTSVPDGRIVPLDAHPDTNNVIWILTS